MQNGTADTRSESGATKKSRGAVISTICKKIRPLGLFFFTYNEEGSRTPERGEDETAHFARTLAAVQNGTADTHSESGATKESRGAVISTI